MLSPNDPRHGTKAGYEAGCRDTCCRKAQARYINQWRMTGPRSIDITGTRRRVEALATLGWSMAELSTMLGHERTYLRKLITLNKSGEIYKTTAERIDALYQRLCMVRATDTDKHTLGWNGCRERTRRWALKRGYAPPLAWDDIDNDTEPVLYGDNKITRSRDEIDEAVVLRVLAGERLKTTYAERREIVRRARARGWSETRIEQTTGITRATDTTRFGDAA